MINEEQRLTRNSTVQLGDNGKTHLINKKQMRSPRPLSDTM
jgi:hypothetical protein